MGFATKIMNKKMLRVKKKKRVKSIPLGMECWIIYGKKEKEKPNT